MNRIKSMLKFGVLCGVCWLRGEEISNPAELLELVMWGEKEVVEVAPSQVEPLLQALASLPPEEIYAGWFKQVVEGEKPVQERARQRILSVGEEIRPYLEEYMKEHRDHADSLRPLVENLRPVDPKKSGVGTASEVMKVVLQLPELTEIQLGPFQHNLAQALKSSERGGLKIDELTPQALIHLIQQQTVSNRMQGEFLNSDLRNWMGQVKDAPFQEAVLKLLAYDMDKGLSVLFVMKKEMGRVLPVLLRPEISDKLNEEQWSVVMKGIDRSYTKTTAYKTMLDRLEKIPEGFLAHAHELMQGPHRHHILLGAYYQQRYPPLREESREVIAKMIQEGLKENRWINFLRNQELENEDLLYLFSVYGWRANDFSKPEWKWFVLKTETIPDADVLNFVATRKPNHKLLYGFAKKRHTIRDELIQMIYQGLKEDFDTYRFHIAGNILGRFSHDSPCPMGLFDEEWVAMLDDPERKSLFVPFHHAARYRISPELLWERYQKHQHEFSERDWRFFSGTIGYLIREGDPDIKREVLAFEAEVEGETLKFSSVKRKALADLNSNELEGLFMLQAQSLFDMCKEKPSQLLGESLFKQTFLGDAFPDSLAYLRANKSQIQAALNISETRPALLPLLSTLATDDGVRREERDFVLESIRLSIETYEEKDSIMLAACFAALSLGDQSREVATGYAESLGLAQAEYNSLWRFGVLLDDHNPYLIPELLRVSEKDGVSDYPMRHALRVSPEHPEVLAKVQKVLHEGDNHALASLLLEIRNQNGLKTSLADFSEERVNWLIRLGSKEELQQTRNILRSATPEDQAALFKRILPEMKTAALHTEGWFKWDVLNGRPELQEFAGETLFELLESENRKHYDYAMDELFTFDSFTREQLQKLMQHVTRFEHNQNAMNLQPNLLRLISIAGEEGAFLERQFRYHARTGSEYVKPVAVGWLAKYAKEETERRRNLDILFQLEREEDHRKGKYVRQIGQTTGYPEIVLPFLTEILQTYLSPAEGQHIDRIRVKQALWMLPKQEMPEEKAIHLYRELWQRSMMEDGDHFDNILPATLWTIQTYYPESLGEFKDLMEKTPFRHRAMYEYRKMKIAMQEHQETK